MLGRFCTLHALLEFGGFQLIRNEALVACDSSLPNLLELRVGAQLAKKRIAIHRRICAVVSIDSKLQHPQSSVCLAAISQMPSKEVIDLRIIVHFHAGS